MPPPSTILTDMDIIVLIDMELMERPIFIMEIRLYLHENSLAQDPCALCGKSSHEHGLLKTALGYTFVCPGNRILQISENDYINVSEEIFNSLMEK